MILVDSGPLVALFDLEHAQHERCVQTLKAFHKLRPASAASDRLRDFIANGGLSVWFFDRASLTRAFELMETYADHPMDLADASLIVAAESLRTRKVFTVDRKDFETYRVRRGHHHYPMEVVP